MITATFEPGKDYAVAEGLWQYDRGQILRIEGLDLPDNVEIDFALTDKGGEAVPCVGMPKNGGIEVTIPDTFLAPAKKENYVIYAFVYRTEGDTIGETTEKIALKVAARPSRLGQADPSDPDPFTEALQQMNDTAALVQYYAALASQSANELASLGLSVVDGAINITYQEG